ncbi:hypothetical protein Tco_1295842, partial [Tanacetum coccineum]
MQFSMATMIPSAKLHIGNEMRHQKSLIGQYNSRNDTRIYKEAHQKREYCTEINVKEAQDWPMKGLPRWQSLNKEGKPDMDGFPGPLELVDSSNEPFIALFSAKAY